ncbi:MAG: class I SAM-dependent methyltransferase [Acidobacteria bacterium]|nr:class I SAM-dependent methyltransferase [Acidobacteriota bacterium]
MMAFYSKHDRIFRKLVPSVAKLSYNLAFKMAGDTVARIVAQPFPELRDLPPNHLCVRIGAGNRVFNGHVNFIQAGNQTWLAFLARNYCTSRSDVVELGCGCGRLARPLRDPVWDPWFEGTYVGVDIDKEMIEYCRQNFPPERFQFILSPHKSRTYSRGKLPDESKVAFDLTIAAEDSKDFVYSLSLFSHLLEAEAVDYLQESYRILRAGGIMFLTFFCMEHVELGQRWTFAHRCGNAYVENPHYPEAAVAYKEAFMTELARKCGFREVTVAPRGGNRQSELVARK